MKNTFYITLISICLGLIVLSCSDDDSNDVAQVTPELSIQMRVGSETLNEGSTYEINETTIQIDVARFYLTNFSFTGNGDDVIDETYHVISPSNNNINLTPVNEGSYDFSFAVGVDPDDNSQTTEDFTTRAQGDPLAAQEPAMHWNWNSGYKFLRIDAQVDTDGDGVVDTPTLYHLGSDAFYAILDSPTQVSLLTDDSEIGLRFDLEGLFSGIDLSDGASTQTMDNIPLAQELLENYTQAFSILN